MSTIPGHMCITSLVPTMPLMMLNTGFEVWALNKFGITHGLRNACLYSTRFLNADPMIDLALEQSIKLQPKNFDPYDYNFVQILETNSSAPLQSDAQSTPASNDDAVFKLVCDKLADDKNIWITYLDSHGATVEESRAKRLDYVKGIRTRGFNAARHLLGHNDGEHCPRRIQFWRDDETNTTQYLRELADLQRSMMTKHGNYKHLAAICIVDCQSLRKWGMHLERAIAVVCMSDHNIGIVMLPWNEMDAAVMDCLMS